MKNSICKVVLTLGMLHWGLLSITDFKTDDPEVTLTYFMARSNLVIWAFQSEKVKTVDFFQKLLQPVTWKLVGADI